MPHGQKVVRVIETGCPGGLPQDRHSLAHTRSLPRGHQPTLHLDKRYRLGERSLLTPSARTLIASDTAATSAARVLLRRSNVVSRSLHWACKSRRNLMSAVRWSRVRSRSSSASEMPLLVSGRLVFHLIELPLCGGDLLRLRRGKHFAVSDAGYLGLLRRLELSFKLLHHLGEDRCRRPSKNTMRRAAARPRPARRHLRRPSGSSRRTRH